MKSPLLGAYFPFGTDAAIKKWLILAAMALLTLPSTNLINAQGILYTVTSTGDGDDALVGDGLCADSNGDCTLRAAIHESNFDSGEDGIEFDISMTDPGFNR
jgi:CSLREA domain-containing protein